MNNFKGNTIELVITRLNGAVSDFSLYGDTGAQLEKTCTGIAEEINNHCFINGDIVLILTIDKLKINGTEMLTTNPVYPKFIKVMQLHYIDSIVFSAGIDKDSLKSFVKLLALKADNMSAETMMAEAAAAGLSHISINGRSFDDGTREVASGTRKKILVVDDNDKLRKMYSEELSDRGYEVRMAANGHEALDTINNVEMPDLIILDVKMAGMSGVELLGRLKQGRINLPVIIATAYPAMKDDITISTFPDHEFLIKPFSYDSLVETIKKMLGE